MFFIYALYRMAHTNVQLVSGNLTTGETEPTFFIDRVNNKVGIKTVPDPTDSNVFQINGGVVATQLYGDGSQITGLNDSKWIESISNPDNIYYPLGNVGIGTSTPGYALDVNGNVNVGTDLTIGSGMRFAGHIIPDGNNLYDIGEPENKIRDIYVDTNSLWIGDQTKIVFEQGKMKFKRRKTNKVPTALVTLATSHVAELTTEAEVQADAVSFAQNIDSSISTIDDLKLEHWRDYAKKFDETKAVTDIFIDNDEDYEAVTASEAFMEVGSNIFTTHSISIGKETDPTAALDVVGDISFTGSIRQTSTSSWTGDPGSGIGKIEYHSNRWYVVAGSDSTELLRVRRDNSDKFFITNEGNIGRTSHSNGYFIGSYNNVEANSYKTNPIYTIGSNYMPSDTSLENMYGIGYSHGNFTGMLTNGWGLYVAAGGTARIGLNANNGHIKCTGYVDAGTEVYCQNWIRTRGNSGHYWESSSNGHGWHIYPKDRSDMFFRSGSGNGSICGTVENTTPRGYIHWTTSNDIGFLSSSREWSLRMDNSKHCHVSGMVRAYGYKYYKMTARYYNSSGNSGSYYASRPISVYAEHHMRCSELQVQSDNRIKKNIVDVDDSSALDLIRKLQPKMYGYVDTAEKGIDRVHGFIAQEVKEIIPTAVSIGEGNVPNIYNWATYDPETNVISIENFDTSNLSQTDSIIYIDHEEQQKTLKIKSVLNSTQLEIEENLEEIVNEFVNISEDDIKPGYEFNNKLFIWGQKVDDFHHLQKSAIFTVATAALQEVDRRQVAHDKRIAALETRNAELEVSLQNVLARLETLEAARV
jgi:hypothetical protein